MEHMRQPGPQTPEKYPRTGPHYAAYGEQPDRVYDYITDMYYLTENQIKEVHKARGIISGEPKKPGLAETVMPIAAGYAAGSFGKDIGTGIYEKGAEVVSKGVDQLGGLFSVGGEAPVKPPVELAPSPVSGGESGGLFSVGGSTPATPYPSPGPTEFLPGSTPGLTPAPGGELLPGGAIPETPGFLANFGSLGPGPQAVIIAQAVGTIKGALDLVQGKKSDLFSRGSLALSTFGISEVVRPLLKAFGSGKGKDQKRRDSFRAQAQEAGFLDENFTHTFTDGYTYDFGLDGGATYEGVDGKQVHHAHEADWANPLTPLAAGELNPLLDIISDGDREQANLAANFINSVTTGVENEDQMRQRIRELYEGYGLNQESVMQQLEKLKANGKIDEGRYQAYANGISSLYDPNGGMRAADLPPSVENPEDIGPQQPPEIVNKPERSIETPRGLLR